MNIYTAQKLCLAGITRTARAAMLADATLHHIHRNIYIDEAPTPERVARALIQGLAQVALTGKTAIEFYNNQPLTFPIELEGPRTIRGKNFYVKHSRLDRVDVRDGMRVVHPLSAARAIPRGTERALERFYSGPVGKRKFLQDVARSRRVSARLRSLLQRISIGADTWGERILGRQLRACGLTVEHNVRMLGYRFDLVLGKYGIVVEIDGWEYHKSLDSFICDRWKTSNASASGFVVLRF
ncbi:MAG: hypothetical protein SOW59_05220, partial [Corynebacterium sp.]|nr:hypothetical protein [Corynebacterium sp.]